MGLEEPVLDERTKVRRRKRTAQRRHAAHAQAQSAAMASWTSVFNLQQHPQYPGLSRPDVLGSDTAGAHLSPPQFTTDQENDLQEQIVRKYGYHDDTSPDPEARLDQQQQQQQQPLPNADIKPEPRSSEVARQVYEQLTAKRIQNEQRGRE